jgi:Tfp pilus assembly protein PilF
MRTHHSGGRIGILRLATAVLAVSTSGCASRDGALRVQQCIAPDARLATIVTSLDKLRDSCTPGALDQPSCDRIRQALLQQALVCPQHEPTLMFNAVFAYEMRRPTDAQQYLDLILARGGSHPGAAVLRARIATEEGNLPYARRMLEEQVTLAPNHAGLRETFGSVLYLAKDWPGAAREITRAGSLGSPPWRIAYNLGLIEEAQGHIENARRLYTEALQGNSQFGDARTRLEGLPPP